MELRKGWYYADKGKHFVLTEKGKAECESYKNKTVGEPVSMYDTEAVSWSVENGYEIEVEISDWISQTGYEVVYDFKGDIIHVGNPIVFPSLELAEKYKNNMQPRYRLDHELIIKEVIWEGKKMTDCRIHNGKKVVNSDWYYGLDTLYVGDYVEDEVVDSLINSISPVSLNEGYFQMGSARNHIENKEGKLRATYATFVKVSIDVWEYRGDCFKGER